MKNGRNFPEGRAACPSKNSAGCSTMKQRPPQSAVAMETARILLLTYGRDAVEMAVLRCAELTKAGDKGVRWTPIVRQPEPVVKV